MNEDFKSQVKTVERSLGECMIETAFTVVRAWMNELGEEAGAYESSFNTIRSKYRELYFRWLSIDDPKSDEELNELTGDAYQLADAVNVDLRIKRGIAPLMHSFNSQSPRSVLQYFESNLRLEKEDLEWLANAINDAHQVGSTLLAITALGRNIRICFNQDSLMVLINGMKSNNEMVANHCVSTVLTILLHYDTRICFFPQIQNAFCDAANIDSEESSERVFGVLLALIEMTNRNLLAEFAQGMQAFSWLPEKLQQLIESTGIKDNSQLFSQWAETNAEDGYNDAMIRNLANTWIADVLVTGNKSRERRMVYTCLKAGHRDYIWEYPDVGEIYYRERLRNGTEDASDYINYAHCMLMKGDRMMAYENYKQARQICGSLRDFYDLFRPDRRQLVEHGVPLEYVYAMEDNLING